MSVKPSRSGRARRRHVAMLLVLLFAASELVCYVALRYLQTKGVVYRPVEGDYAAYLADRDPVLGWPRRSELARDSDAVGSRPVPAFPDPAASPAIVSLYGDSFTWGSEVDDEHAWGNVLAQRLGRRVNNFGVRGYGSDQAALRFRLNENDTARVVVLAHLSENVLRNVNRYRDLLGSSGGLAFKPRFVAGDDDALTLVPMPELTPESYRACVRHPGDFLEHETFLPGSRFGPARPAFPFTWRVIRSFGHRLIVSRLTGRPHYASFYAPDHPARGTAVTAGILAQFAGEARTRGRVPVVLVLPTGRDIADFRARGVWSYAPLAAELDRRGLAWLDAGVAIERRLAGRDPAEIFGGGDLGRHFNEEGYRLLAEIVHEHLVASGAVPPPVGSND